MKIVKLIILASLILFSEVMNAQEDVSDVRQYDRLAVGPGVGIDHGGFGVNLSAYPSENFGFFVGGGYALAGIGLNAGVKARYFPPRPNPTVVPYLTAMYGYNTAIVVSNDSDMNKLFYGATFGVGVDIRPKPWRLGYFSCAVLIPIRGDDVDKYIDNNNLDLETGLIPIGLSFGFNFILK